MKTNFILSFTLCSILLLGIFGLFYGDAFAQNPSLNDDDYKAEERQKELEQKKAEQKEKAEERQKELEQKKAEQKEKAEERQKELEQKKAEQKEKAEERQNELEQKKAELVTNRENLEAKQSKKFQQYEEKLKEIKEKSQNKIKANISSDEISLKSKQIEEQVIKKSEEIQQRLAEKSDELDSRIKNILDKINDGQYMGVKTPTKDYTETFELTFDSVDASQISNQSQMSTLTGKMTFTLYDKSKSDLKLELNECNIVVDEINYNCGFGKARTVSSGQSGAKDSLVIMAFLEDGVLEELHTTMKLFVNANIPINNIDQSQVSIIGPQSKISNLWILNGNATLTKITSENTVSGNNITTSLEEGMSFGDK